MLTDVVIRGTIIEAIKAIIETTAISSSSEKPCGKQTFFDFENMVFPAEGDRDNVLAIAQLVSPLMRRKEPNPIRFKSFRYSLIKGSFGLGE